MRDALHTVADFLVELLTEELPPTALPTLEAAFAGGLLSRIDDADLAHGAVQTFATPRRLAVLISALALKAGDQAVQRRGPPLTAAFDGSGAPTRAALAFAASCEVALTDLGREQDAKGNTFLSFTGTKSGAAAADVLARFVSESLDALPIPRRMRWGAGEAQFVRPVHGLVLLHGDALLPATVLGVSASRSTVGHRFMAPEPIYIEAAADYPQLLEQQGKVIASFAQRRERIRLAVQHQAAALGGTPLMSDALLDEVTALVEWPVPVAGQFETRFLTLPREVLVSTLQAHQRYFPVEDSQGALLPWFITISNIDSTDAQAVRAGNERVVRPRLADAAFFYAQDQAQPLASRIAALDKVTFQAQLGSIGDKVRRLAALARVIAARIEGDEAAAVRAAQLCKCDLVTSMVGEFPDLQGVMGRYYAVLENEPAEVASAIAEHYLPRGAGDGLPQTRTGLALAIADKLDTLTGIFAIGQKPSGTKDPFALRRAAIGIGRMIYEHKLPLDLVDLIEAALQAHTVFEAPLAAGGKPLATRAAVAEQVYDYLMERQRNAWLEPPDGGPPIPGITPEVCDAVLSTRPRSPLDFDARIRAVLGFLALPEAASLTAANKRIANLLKKSAADDSGATHIDDTRLQDGAERALYQAVLAAEHSVPGKVAVGDYATALGLLAHTRPAVDAFFDDVMVMDPDPALRANRLALLTRLRALFVGIADLSRLPG